MSKVRIAPALQIIASDGGGRWGRPDYDVNIPIPHHLSRFRGQPPITIRGYFHENDGGAPSEVALELLWTQRVAGHIVAAYCSTRTRNSYVVLLDRYHMVRYFVDFVDIGGRNKVAEFAERTAKALSAEVQRSPVVPLALRISTRTRGRTKAVAS